MRHYRAYILGTDNHRYQKVAQFASAYADDLGAMNAAEQLVDGHDVELWECARLVARFDHKSGSVMMLDQLPMAALQAVPSEPLAPNAEVERKGSPRAKFLAAAN
jgi:hypothetical protein